MELHSILLHTHSGFRWIFLILILAAIVKASFNLGRNSAVSKDKIIFLLTLVMAHIQLIIGLVLYFTSPKVVFEASSMSSPLLRFFLVEHISLMIIAIILITVGYVKSKRITDIRKKNRTILIYYAISLVLILTAIPWPFRDLGAGWV